MRTEGRRCHSGEAGREEGKSVFLQCPITFSGERSDWESSMFMGTRIPNM